MAFRRPTSLPERPLPVALDACMVGIGMSLAARPRIDADIELTLVFASEAGMCDGDLRVLSVLTTWMGVHYAHVNVDRLVRFVGAHGSPRVKAYWAAVGRWLGKDRRFARLESGFSGEPIDLLTVGTDFQLMRRGEDERFAGSCLRVPAGALRDRAGDVLAPEVLVRRHSGYRNRVRMGATWRADVWTMLEKSPDAPVAEVARRVACSFATAWQAARDFELLRHAKCGSSATES